MEMIENTRRRRLNWAVSVIPVVAALAVLATIWRGSAAATEEFPFGEPFRFNHQIHLAADVECVFCHSGAMNGPIAGIPSVQKCVGCHQNIQVTSEEGQADVETLLAYWEAGRPLRWEKTYDQPDFVRFTHQPHIASGVNCEECHGDVSSMTVVRPAYRINMGFCLHCHRQQDPELVDHLVNCATCHQ